MKALVSVGDNHLTEQAAIQALRDFFQEKPFLVFGTGTSCAVDPSFGMPALRDALMERLGGANLTGVQGDQWYQVTASLNSGADLESALSAVGDPDLLKTIVAATGDYVASCDRTFSSAILMGQVRWPATRLLERLVETLPAADPVLHALTPNYDTLFEVACDSAGILHTSGFIGGIERHRDWIGAQRSFLKTQMTQLRGRLRKTGKFQRHVCLYKVHGSLNYFFCRNQVVDNDAWMWSPPESAERVMVTPGVSKFEVLQRYRQELLSSADEAIDKAGRFLFLGYGFNDKHLEEYIERKIVTQGCPGLVVTRETNPRIEALVASAPSMWSVSKSTMPGISGTQVMNARFEAPIHLTNEQLWDFSRFASRMFGG